MIPMDAIDPDARSREWVRVFEWHLDLLPPVMDAIVTTALPSIPVSRGGSRFDRVQIDHSKYVDNMEILDRLTASEDGRLVDGAGAARDAQELWDWVVAYTRAVDAWITTQAPAPTLADKVDADPLTARTLARVAIAWLIDHAPLIEPVHELDEHRDAMFATIRRMRGRYGVYQHPRPARPGVCRVCGERAVVVTWVDGPNGSPKPVQAGRCRTCGQQYTTTTEEVS